MTSPTTTTPTTPTTPRRIPPAPGTVLLAAATGALAGGPLLLHYGRGVNGPDGGESYGWGLAFGWPLFLVFLAVLTTAGLAFAGVRHSSVGGLLASLVIIPWGLTVEGSIYPVWVLVFAAVTGLWAWGAGMRPGARPRPLAALAAPLIGYALAWVAILLLG